MTDDPFDQDKVYLVRMWREKDKEIQAHRTGGQPDLVFYDRDGNVVEHIKQGKWISLQFLRFVDPERFRK